MSSVIRNTRAAAALMVLSAAFGAGAAGATRDDELTVDPTVPLDRLYSIRVADATDSEGGGLGFDLDGLFGGRSSYELSSVLIRAENRMAVINGKRVSVGDKVDSATVASIESDRVTLNVDGEIHILELYKNSIRTRARSDE